MKFATKPIWHYPPHLRYVATLPWKIENSNFLQIFSSCVRKCKQIAYLLPIHPQILIFSVFQIAKFSMSLLFYLFTFAISLWHRKFVTADVTAVFVNNQLVFSNKDKILIKTCKYSQNTVIHTEELKSVHLKCNLFTFSSISGIIAKYLQKIWIFNFSR